MNAMSEVSVQEIQWFAVRMKSNASGGPRTVVVDVEREQYTNRAGQKAWRKVKGTGARVFLSEHLIRRAGFEVFLPVKKVWRIKNRFTKEKHLVAVPLLADWLFVGLPLAAYAGGLHVAGWKRLMDLDVVAGVMGTGGRPIKLSDASMSRLMRQFGQPRVEAGLRRRIAAGRVIGAGDCAKIVDGPFESFACRVIDIDGDSAKVILNLFGRETPARIELDLLR